ncbi:MAG TPA: hypothetical protein VGI39_29130 [Polyangiaceae bacterium]|jgi:hypothetical protein
MHIAYTAHTETCTLLLDGEGVCRSVLAAAGHGRGRPARIPSSAEKCIGAQYVATLDLREPGGLVPMPQAGAQMLFAKTEKDGRITLVRSAPVLRFETTPTTITDIVESGIHERPEVSFREDDDELTVTLPFTPSRISLAATPAAGIPARSSGIVPAGTAVSATIPPPPPAPRMGPTGMGKVPRPVYVPPPRIAPPSQPAITPRRPSVVRVNTASSWEADTTPFKRAGRR